MVFFLIMIYLEEYKRNNLIKDRKLGMFLE